MRPGPVSTHPVAPFKLKGFFPTQLPSQFLGISVQGKEEARRKHKYRGVKHSLSKSGMNISTKQDQLPQDQHLGSASQTHTPLPRSPLSPVLTCTTNLSSLAGSSMRGDILAFSGKPQPLCKEQKLSWAFCMSKRCLSLQGHKPRTRVPANSSAVGGRQMLRGSSRHDHRFIS